MLCIPRLLQSSARRRCWEDISVCAIKQCRANASSSLPAIPVIDFNSANADGLLDNAFSTTGFAVVTNHGISEKLTSDLRLAGKSFFRQPLEEKQRYNNNRGYGFGGYLHEEEANGQLLGNFGNPNDWNESLTLPGGLPRLWSEGDKLDPECFGDQNAKDVVWSQGTVQELGFEALVTEWKKDAYQFGGRLNQLVGDILDEHAAVENSVNVDGAGVRLAYYPAQKTAAAPGQLRAGEHVDSGGITILVRDDLAPWGTQVQLADSTWVDVPYVPEALVLNVGALLSRWTNGRWKAAVHRVGNDAAERLSIVSGAMTFKSDAVIQPLVSCVSADCPAQYVPVVAGEFLSERVKLHRPTYAEENGMSNEEAVESLKNKIQAYQI